MKGHSLIRIHSAGGLFTTQDIRSIVKLAIYYGVDYFYAGTRQELLFYIKDDQKSSMTKKMKALDIKYFEDFGFNNIVSSIPSVNVFSSKTWLKSGIYLDIINSFKISPKLTIGIVDPEQELTPLLYNQMNFIASDDPGYWYLYLCITPNSKPFLWPVKVDTNSLYSLAKQIGGIVIGDKISDGEELVAVINDNINYNHLAFNEKPVLPNHAMPNYDGIHNASNDRYWLGITQQENRFSTSFLEALAYLCQRQKNNNIYLTNWGSILIRHIQKTDLMDWNQLLGEHSINTGHSYSELNWIMADIDHEARKIKRRIVSYFYKKNARTEGLTFGIDTGMQEIYPHVLIKEIVVFGLIGWKKYDVSFVEDFDVNRRDYIPYRQRVSKTELPEVLYSLCQDYSKFLSKGSKAKSESNQSISSSFMHDVYQCKQCMTVYDPQYGDQEAGVLPGISFDELKDTYCCSVCGANKSQFEPVNVSDQLV